MKGDGNTFERSRRGVKVTSRIDFAVEGGGARLGTLETVWGLSDYSAIGGAVQVDALEGVVDLRVAIDWEAVALMVAD